MTRRPSSSLSTASSASAATMEPVNHIQLVGHDAVTAVREAESYRPSRCGM